MSNYGTKVEYKHFVSKVKEVPDWYKLFKFVLIEDIDTLKSIRDSVIGTKYYMAFDTETASLDPEECNIQEIGLVGYSFCLDGKTAYYVAVNHKIDKYNLGEEAVEIVYEMLCGANKAIMYNARFDVRMMEYQGFTEEHQNKRFRYVKYDMSKVEIFDVMNSCWLADTNVKMPSLKAMALHFLGYKMQTFEEVSEGVENFYYINPKDCFFYASADALCTYLLTGATMSYFIESGFSGKVDNKVLYPLLQYENEKIFLDKEILPIMSAEFQDIIDNLAKEIFAEVGVIKLNSPAQVSNAFSQLGIDTVERTKTGYMKTGIEILKKLPQETKDSYPILAKFIDYKTNYKFLSSYVKVLNKIALDKGYVRCSYKTTQVPTGRLASGKDKKNTFFSAYNIQSSPKPHPMLYYALDFGDRELFDRKENIVMGFKFVPVQYKDGEIVDGNELFDNFLYLVEGFDPRGNIRSAFLPKPTEDADDNDWIFCSIDFCISPETLVELRDGSKVPLKFLEGREVDIKTPEGYKKAHNFRYTGKKKVCKLKLKSGKEVVCSPEHKFKVLTVDGVECWKELKTILPTDNVLEDSL